MTFALKCLKPEQDIFLGNIGKKLHQPMKSENTITNPKTCKITTEMFCYI